jgi:hypothetical protein
MIKMPRHPEERRMLELLRDLIALAGMRVDSLETRLGWEPGRLDDLLANRRGLAVEELVEVLPLLNLQPADFFARLYGLKEKEKEMPVEKAATTRLDRRFDESRRVVEDALARRAAWKRERGRERD